jgi:hypothetical protein
LRNCVQQIEKGGTGKYALQTHIHEAIYLFDVAKAFVDLREVGGAEVDAAC